MTPITSTADLADFCARLEGQAFVAVDTEFMRETTYWPKLCLIQAAAPGGIEATIDPLAEGLDLSPFLAVMRDTKVLKVFHAARQDVEIFHNLGAIPEPLFDTQIAGMAAGFGEQVAYDALARKILKVELDKSHRFTDWSRRPLSPAQVKYAISDVTHLRDVFVALDADLQKRGRAEWVGEEMEVLTSPETYRADPEMAWERLKTRVRKPKELAVLMEVAAWREREAQTRDVPRGRVLKDDVLGEIATQAPTTVERLAGLRSLPRGFERSKWGQDILAAVARGLARDPKTLPRLERPRGGGNGAATVELLKVLLRMTSERHAVAAKVIATIDELEQIAADDNADVPALHGWRRELFGDKALALKHGRLALAVEDNRVIALERGAAEGAG
jgi:ribonuclease D